jgi:hypothetical protein
MAKTLCPDRPLVNGYDGGSINILTCRFFTAGNSSTAVNLPIGTDVANRTHEVVTDFTGASWQPPVGCSANQVVHYA